MAFEVSVGEDPGWALQEAGEFLAADPVPHNLILTLLNARVAHPEPGRYWVVRENGAVVGMAFQSPLDYFAILTPMGPGPISALVEKIVKSGVNLPGVNGEAGTAARFAGQWTERRGSAAFPVDGQRVYELRGSPQGTPAGGLMRRASLEDMDLVLTWMRGFLVEIGEDTRGLSPMMERRLEAGHRCILYTDLGNPTSNSVYRRIGYRAVREGLRYRFD